MTPPTSHPPAYESNASGAPGSILAIEHEGETVRLIQWDMAAGRRHAEPGWEGVGTAAFPSPLRHTFAYLRQGVLMLHAGDNAADRQVMNAVDNRATRPVLFSPDGAIIAVAVRGGLALVRTGDPAGKPANLRFPGRTIIDCLWTYNGAVLLVVSRPDRQPRRTEFSAIDVATSKQSVIPATGVRRLLGWSQPDRRLIALYTDDNGDEIVGAVGAAGQKTAIFNLPEESFVERYLPLRGVLVVGKAGEHGGDPVHYTLLHPSGQQASWLENFSPFFDLFISADESRAAFVQRVEEERSGTVWLVSMDSGSAEPVLGGRADGLVYSSPVLQP